MKKSITTSTTSTIILCGISTLASSNINKGDLDLVTEQELYAIELKYNPELDKTRIDEYVENAYYFKVPNENNLNSVEFNFLELTQKFSTQQIELDQDFTGVLDNLFLSQNNNKPSKKRF